MAKKPLTKKRVFPSLPDTKYRKLKEYVTKMIRAAGSGHYASSISALRIMYPLFYGWQKGNSIKPDQFILSKGHAAPALYAILYDLGYIKKIDNFRQYGWLPGHPELVVPGVTCSSGSLGMGISKAAGLAVANPKKQYHVLVGDGELQEGQNWEALIYLISNHIENVTIHVDCNNHQYSGEVGDRGLACLHLLYTEDHQMFKQIKLHFPRWERDNNYLTRMQMSGYIIKIGYYTETLLDLMEDNDKVIILDADLIGDFGLKRVAGRFPGRFIECGISEQHMVSMANGLALSGYMPICHTFGAFYRRAIDQIYNNHCDQLLIVYTAGMVGHHRQNTGMSHEATPGKDMLSWLPDILVTNEIDDLPKYIGQRSIYLELEID